VIQLIFTACLAALPERCDEHSVALLPEIGVMGCMMTAQPQLAEWTERHPGHRVVRWRCGWLDDSASST
jgi:hypothetical protein